MYIHILLLDELLHKHNHRQCEETTSIGTANQVVSEINAKCVCQECETLETLYPALGLSQNLHPLLSAAELSLLKGQPAS